MISISLCGFLYTRSSKPDQIQTLSRTFQEFKNILTVEIFGTSCIYRTLSLSNCSEHSALSESSIRYRWKCLSEKKFPENAHKLPKSWNFPHKNARITNNESSVCKSDHRSKWSQRNFTSVALFRGNVACVVDELLSYLTFWPCLKCTRELSQVRKKRFFEMVLSCILSMAKKIDTTISCQQQTLRFLWIVQWM